MQSHPGTMVDWVDLAPQRSRAVNFGLDASPGRDAPLSNDQVFVDPYTGAELGERLQGDLSQGAKNIMPFVYALHTSLALGDAGTWALGIAALLWTLDCFVGFYLTLPRQHRSARRDAALRSPRPWLSRWKAAWAVRWFASAAKLVFDLHRAGGLWTWAMLFGLAWSGVGFNLPAVYQPVMRALTGYQTAPEAERSSAVGPASTPPMGWQRARQLASEAMANAARQGGFEVKRERLIHHDARRRLYEYRVLSTLDVGDRLGNTTLFLDDASGRLVRLDLPTGQHVGNTIDTWLAALHTVTIGGLPMQVLVSLTGVIVTMLSTTGVWLWWRRRASRRRAG